MNIDEISDFQPNCMATHGFTFEDAGTKMPDSCCEADAWKKIGTGPPSFLQGPRDVAFEKKCYIRDAPQGFDKKKIRNYIGCENGVLMANEECVPSDVTMA